MEFKVRDRVVFISKDGVIEDRGVVVDLIEDEWKCKCITICWNATFHRAYPAGELIYIRYSGSVPDNIRLDLEYIRDEKLKELGYGI